MADEVGERGPGRRVGRDRVVDAAVQLLESADLADLLSFLGTRAVADAADVRPATVHHHFGNPGADTKSNARLVAAVLERCLGAEVVREGTVEVAAVGGSPEVEAGDISALSGNAAANLAQRFEDRTQAIATFLAGVAAHNDPDARAALLRDYQAIVAEYAAVFDLVVRALGRRYDTEHGWSGEMMALFGVALSDGLTLRHQFDPGSIDLDMYGELCLRLFEVVTVPEDDELATDAATDRLLRRASTINLPAESGLDPTKRSRIVSAVRDLYDDGGAGAITVSAVARTAGVSRGTVLANFGDRSGLAAVVWARHLPDLELRLETDRDKGLPLARTLERHLLRVADRCREDRELTALMIDGIMSHAVRHGAPTYVDPADPRSTVPLAAMLAPVLADAADELRPELGGSPESPLDLAATITNLAMVRTMSRTHESPSESVQRVMDLVLDGMLRR